MANRPLVLVSGKEQELPASTVLIIPTGAEASPISTPSAPSGSDFLIYPKTDGWYMQDASGNEIQIVGYWNEYLLDGGTPYSIYTGVSAVNGGVYNDTFVKSGVNGGQP